jgi:hypothetical protein
MQVGTYPTRNFAQFCYYLYCNRSSVSHALDAILSKSLETSSSEAGQSFLLASACRHAARTISSFKVLPSLFE